MWTRRGISPPLRLLLFAYRWLVAVPFLAIALLAYASACSLLSILGFPEFASRVVASQWGRVSALICLMRIKVRGLEHLVRGQSYVIVANHRSLVDIFLVYGFMPAEFKWVMKRELRSVPALGYACEKMGHVIIDRSNTEAALKSINDAKSRIRNGISILFFAEGARSRDNRMLPFKKGAFALAVDLELPILPVSIHGTYDMLPPDTIELSPGNVTLRFHAPIRVTKDSRVEELLGRTRQTIESALMEE